MKLELDGIGVLITRPAGQAGRIAELIDASGGKPILFPAVGIEPLPEVDKAEALNDLQQFGLLIFVSPNAVRLAMPHILKHGGVPASSRVAAVGPGTAAELKKSAVRNIISPREGFDSEALIRELSSLSMNGIQALVIRGQGGRDLLGETLRSRGAKVDYLECYRRFTPDRGMDELLPLWRDRGLNACIATSSTIVNNLYAMAGEGARPWLLGMPFFVSHPRVAAAAFSHGVRLVFVAGISDDALVAGLKTWFARLRAPKPADRPLGSHETHGQSV
jgi:uroporphyrinogen-III synthase